MMGPMQVYKDEAHMQRGPEVLLPKRVHIHVKKMLGLPVYAIMRHPVPGGRFQYNMQRVA